MGLLSSRGEDAAGCCGSGRGATRVDRTDRTSGGARCPRAASVLRRRASHRPECGAQPPRRRREAYRAAMSARAGARCQAPGPTPADGPPGARVARGVPTTTATPTTRLPCLVPPSPRGSGTPDNTPPGGRANRRTYLQVSAQTPTATGSQGPRRPHGHPVSARPVGGPPTSGTFRRELRGPTAPREETAVKTRDLAYIALFAAIIAVLGTIPAIPVGPVPITAQTLGVMLAGGVLGARRGFLSVLLFLVLVAVGLPLLASGAGGLAPFVGTSAGYLYS